MSRRTAALVAGLVALLLVAAGGAALALRPSSSALARVLSPSPPAAVALPTRTPLLAPLPSLSPAPLPATLARALVAPGLGSALSASVVDVATGTVLLDRGASTPSTPASTNKIVTAVAALTALDPTTRLTTRVVQGLQPGDVVLVGAGDPTLAGTHPVAGFPRPARLSDLAAAVKRSGVVVRRVLVDDTLFAGARLAPGWKPDYVTTGNVAPVDALELDEGRTSSHAGSPRVADPALAAGAQLARLLGVTTPVVRGAAPAGATQLGGVSSPPLADLVEGMLTRSDNDLAEALLRQVALHAGQPATFAGGAAAAAATVAPLLTAAGVPASVLALQDGSGLSRLDRIQPRGLTALLAAVTAQPRLAALLSGLPVAGFDGTLEARYRTGPTAAAGGEVRGKTGTLDGVSALAGLVRTRSGRLLAFDLAADAVTGGRSGAQAGLDGIATVLASS